MKIFLFSPNVYHAFSSNSDDKALISFVLLKFVSVVRHRYNHAGSHFTHGSRIDCAVNTVLYSEYNSCTVSLGKAGHVGIAGVLVRGRTGWHFIQARLCVH